MTAPETITAVVRRTTPVFSATVALPGGGGDAEALAAEAAARVAGDATNAAAITAEATTRAAADTAATAALALEVATRSGADTAEAAARVAGDATNATAITAEATARAAGDATNAAAITAEATARAAGDTAVALWRLVPWKAAVGDWVAQPHENVLAATQNLNRVAYVPFIIPDSWTHVDGIAAEVTTTATGALCRLGLVLPHATTARPDARVIDGGTVDYSATGGAAGPRALTITRTAVTGGSLIYVAVCPQGATAPSRHATGGEWLRSFGFASPTLTDVFRATSSAAYYENGVAGALPATATPIVLGSVTAQPLVALRGA